MFKKYITFIRGATLFLIGAILLSVFPLSVYAAEQSTRDGIIVSLGDSYSSGEGILPFYGEIGTMAEKVQCHDWLAHRSVNAWSGMLTLPWVNGPMSENRDEHWFFAAASGATTEHLLNYQTKDYSKGKYVGSEDLDPQLSVFDQLGNRKADYVTLTLGGNDADFTGIITEVMVGCTYLNLSGLPNKLNKTWEEFYKEDGIADKLDDAYQAIAKKAGKQACILVAGYPKLLDQNGKGLLVSKEEASLVNIAVSNFNNAIEHIVNQCRDSGMNIHFVPVEDAFDGHEAYSEHPFITEVLFGPILQSEDLKDFGICSSYSMHPNYLGSLAYACCVQTKIGQLESERLSSVPSTNSPGDKQLSQLNVYMNGSLYRSYTLQYNNDQQLSGATFKEFTGEEGFTANFTYTYDSAGRLLEADRDDLWLYFGNDMYVYNDAGLLVNHQFYWGRTDYPYRQSEYEYDSQGNLISETEFALNYDSTRLEPVCVRTYQYLYDDLGRISEKHGYIAWIDGDFTMTTKYGSYPYSQYISVTRYEYDADGRILLILETEIPSDQFSPLGNPHLVQDYPNATLYDYDYPPFVLTSHSGDAFTLYLCDSAGTVVWQQYLGDGEIVTDKDGYIVQVTTSSDSFSYELIYQESAS